MKTQKKTLKKRVLKKKAVKKKKKKKAVKKSPSIAKKKAALLEALKNNLGIVSTSCDCANVSRSSFYKWHKEDEEFKKAVDDIENIALDFVETKHYELIRLCNPSSIIFHLKTKGRNRGYREKYEVEHSGDIGIEEIKSSIRNFLDDEKA